MSLVPTIYSSADPGAPVLTGQVGSLVALLDALLVDGYGAGPDAKTPLGWSREYTATNKRVYRNDPLEGSGYLLRVDDTGTIGNARHAWLRGYQLMSDIDTGINPLPTAAQEIDGIMLIKSTALSSAPRAWWAIGTATCLYLFANLNSTGLRDTPYFFGDFKSRLPGDMHNFVVSGSTSTTYTGSTTSNHSITLSLSTSLGSLLSSHSNGMGYVARDETGALGSAYFGIHATGTGSVGSNGAVYPDSVGGELLVERVIVRGAGSYIFRGHMPGLLAPLHPLPFVDRTQYDDVAVLGGISVVAKTFKNGAINNDTGIGQALFVVGEEW